MLKTRSQPALSPEINTGLYLPGSSVTCSQRILTVAVGKDLSRRLPNSQIGSRLSVRLENSAVTNPQMVDGRTLARLRVSQPILLERYQT